MVITTKKEATEVLEAIIGVVKKEFPDNASDVLCRILHIQVEIE